MLDRKGWLVQGGVVLVSLAVGAVTTALVLPAFQAREKVASNPVAPQPPAVVAVAPVVPPSQARAEAKAEGEKTEAKPAEAPLAPLPVAKVALPAPRVGQMRISTDPMPDTKAARPRPEDVLSSKGLKRSGSVFVLDEEQPIRDKIADLERIQTDWQSNQERMLAIQNQGSVLNQQWMALQEQKRGLLMRVNSALMLPVPSRLSSPGSTVGKQAGETEADRQNREQREQAARAEDARRAEAANMEFERARLEFMDLERQIGFAERQYLPLQNEYVRRESQGASQAREFQQTQSSINSSVETLMRKYEELNRDSEVRAALAELNTEGLRVSLGPVENHRRNLERMLKEQLEAKGAKLGPMGRITSQAAQDVKSAKESTVLYAVQLKRMPPPSYARVRKDRPSAVALAQKVQDLESQLAKAGSAAQKKLGGDLKKAQSRLAERTKERQSRDDYGTLRDAYVRAVVDLRKAADLARAKQAELANEPVRFKGKTLKVRQLADPDLNYLKHAEETIVAGEVSLEPDKSASWVEVFVNGQSQPQKMVVDPSADVVRISETLAGKLGITPGNPRVTVQATLDDGQVVEGWQTFLKSVKVGSDDFAASDVECLVLVGHEAPPVLGASFLEQFSSHLDVEAGKLILKKVNATRLSKLSTMR